MDVFSLYFQKYVICQKGIPVKVRFPSGKYYCAYCKKELRPNGPGSVCSCKGYSETKLLLEEIYSIDEKIGQLEDRKRDIAKRGYESNAVDDLLLEIVKEDFQTEKRD